MIDQIGIFVCSVLSIWFISGTKHRALGFAVGFCGQPFWLWAAIHSRQWAVILLAFYFSFCHARGFINERRHNPKPKTQ